MNIELRTTEWKEVIAEVNGTTIFNTDDYTELKGKTVDEIEQMDLKTLLELEHDSYRLVERLQYDYDVDLLETKLKIDELNDAVKTEITVIGYRG